MVVARRTAQKVRSGPATHKLDSEANFLFSGGSVFSSNPQAHHRVPLNTVLFAVISNTEPGVGIIRFSRAVTEVPRQKDVDHMQDDKCMQNTPAGKANWGSGAGEE